MYKLTESLPLGPQIGWLYSRVILPVQASMLPEPSILPEPRAGTGFYVMIF